jgi:hypothetical protein
MRVRLTMFSARGNQKNLKGSQPIDIFRHIGEG